jgi:hypothetical protein
VSYSAHRISSEKPNTHTVQRQMRPFIRTARHNSGSLEIAMKPNKSKRPEPSDLRDGVEGSVLVKDTNENFAGKAPNTSEPGPALATPGVGLAAAGQTTHE